ncbi:hypothetical protein CR513_46286, partial [Mucuna pruriens]
MILDEAHKGKLGIHLGTTKMYQDLKKIFWWPKMKREVDNIHEHIWIIVDRLTKFVHFLPINIKFTSRFWGTLHQALRTKLHLSSTYHYQIDGQSNY